MIFGGSVTQLFTALGLQSMARQLASAVGITGGTIAGLTQLDFTGLANPTLRVRNANDTAGAFLGNTYSAGQLGLYDATGNTASGVVAAGAYRTVFAWDNQGRVGSVTSAFGSPTFRNMLDDGSGNASFFNNLSAQNIIQVSGSALPVIRSFNTAAPGPSGGTAGRYGETYVDPNGTFTQRFVNGAYNSGPAIFTAQSDVNSSPTLLNFYGTSAIFNMPLKANSPGVTVSDNSVATMAAMRNVLMYVTPEMYGAVGDNTADDRTAFTNALAASSFKKPLILTATYFIGGAGILTIPSNVSLISHSRYHGSDSPSMPSIQFTDNTGGVYLSPGASLTGITVIGASTATVAAITYGGQFGLYNVKTSSCPRGLAADDFFGNGRQTISILNAGTGLTNGVYGNVAFTTTANSASSSGDGLARLQINVASNKISAVVPYAGGHLGAANVVVSLAANALYSGSPAISNCIQLATINSGRSRIDGYFASNHSGLAVEVDSGFDFFDCRDIHVWNGNFGSSGYGQAGIRIGKCDGISLVNPKVFGYAAGIIWDVPKQGFRSFGTCTGQELDLIQSNGHIIQGPIQLDITGGYIRSVGNGVFLNDPTTQLSVKTQILSQSGYGLYASDFDMLNVSGCNFSRDAATPSSFSIIIFGGSGRNLYNVDGNTSDGNSPFACLYGSAKVGFVGQNSWPGRNYAAKDANSNIQYGYARIDAGSLARVHNWYSGTVSGSTDANGQIKITHNQGFISQSPKVSVIGSSGNFFLANIISQDTESFTVQVFTINQGTQTNNGKVAPSGQAVTISYDL